MTSRPTKTILYRHTFHPEAEAELVTLTNEDARLEQAEKRPQRASVKTTPAMRRAEIAERTLELHALLTSGDVLLHFTALPRGDYRTLITANMPRKGDPEDEAAGYDVDHFPEALIRACLDKVTTLDGEPVENRWDEWADQMTDGQWEEIYLTVLSLNRRGSTAFPR